MEFKKPSSCKKTWNVCPYAVVVLVFFSGSYINKRLKLNTTHSARMCFIVSLLGFLLTTLMYIKCETPSIPGVNTSYQKRVKDLFPLFVISHTSSIFSFPVARLPYASLWHRQTSSGLSSIRRRRVSSPDEILKRDTVSNAWYYFSNKIILLFSKSNC